MKITTLIENTSLSPEFACEHGLSLFIETERHTILFDAGQSGLFADNAEKLGIDLNRVDIAFLSHGHYDHSGGLMRFLELNDHAPIYMNENAFAACHNAENKYIGVNLALRDSGRLRLTGDEAVIDEELSLLTCNRARRIHPSSGQGLTVLTDRGLVPDDFTHEHYLVIREGNRKIVVSGCSHKGVLNIAEWLRPDVLVGGFHFMKLDPFADRDALFASAETLLSRPTEYYTGHCTGCPQYDILKERMGDRLHYLAAGSVYTI